MVVLSGCTSTTVLSCHGNASVEVCRNNRITPAARSEAKPKPKSQTTAALCNTCIFKRMTTSNDPLRYVHTHPLRSLFSLFFYFPLFISFTFFPFLSYFFSSFLHSLLPLPYHFLLFLYVNSTHPFIHSSFCFFYSVLNTKILYSFHPLFFFLSVLTQTSRSFPQSLQAQVKTDGLLPNP